MRRIVAGILEGLGYEVQQAGHGREGLDVLDGGWVPDLVCVDWNMPVMDGLQFVSAVRANPAWRSVTIMMVTSDRKSTRLKSSHANISHAVFCLKKKNTRIGLRSPYFTIPTSSTIPLHPGAGTRPLPTSSYTPPRSL